ncbi:hypothetical protein F4680DRAFT_436612 [Xylaria scruposa]|nr:hypothetical protein F4680DRAFT_436612 [Xylaria scruposa]
MADPLSIAGLATGVISLGLQVVGGLFDYLDAVKGRAEELSSAKQQATNMKDLLMAVQDLLPQLENSWPTSAILLERHIQSCNAEISALCALLSALSQPASSSSGIRLKLAEQKQKFAYPFNRNHLSDLEERLVKVNSALQTALQITGLGVSIITRGELRQMHDAFETTRDEFQQMREALHEMCQSTAVRARKTEACLSLTANESPQRIAKGGGGMPLDSFEAASSLASRPSLLSTSIETVIKCDTLLSGRGNGPSACLCRPSRRITHSKRSWQYLSFSYGTSDTRRHLPSCPFSRIDGERRATDFTIEYSSLKRLYSMAFVLSFTNSHGAGGRSISPSFTYYPTVDEVIAPTFRILRSARYMLQYMVRNSSKVKITDVVKVLQHCFDNVLVLYYRGKASPGDINSYGESIIHAAVNIIDPSPNNHEDHPLNHSLVADTMFSGITNLIAGGVPVANYNRHGSTACGYLLRASHRAIYSKFAKLLIPHASEVSLQKPLGFHRTRYYGLGSNTILKQDLKLAEAAGCGSLSLAALAGNERLVKEILNRHPDSFEEVNNFGHTPLHLAVNHPVCLRLILEAGGSSILESLDVERLTPLECACVSGVGESVRLLLDAGSRITSTCIERVTSSCQDDLLTTLKQRRDELKRLALYSLTKTEAEFWGLQKDAVLDVNGFKVQQLLQSRGVSIPSRLCSDWTSSVYLLHFTYNSATVLDQLWTLGFRDIDSFDQPGGSPVLQQYNFDAVRWLIDHGVDYWTPLNERRDGVKIDEPVTPAHFVLAKMGRQVRITLKPLEFLETHRWLIGKLLQVRVSDACSCQCSIGGCTPFTAFLDYRTSDSDLYPSHIRTSEDRAWLWANFIKAFQTHLSQDDLVLLVRHLTFDALELTHTCCLFTGYLDWYVRGGDTSEEIDEINSEKSKDTVLALFADLMSYFEQVAFEDQGGIPLIASDPEEFFIRRWLPRITEALDTLNGSDLTPEEKSAAEAIGVVWGPQPAHTIACEVDPWDYSPEYVMREMEKIMNE